MKKICILILILSGLAVAGAAQTNAPLAKPATPLTQITSDSADFDLNARLATYRGHVRVADPKVALACDWMVVNLPAPGGRLDRIVATTNVVIDFVNEKGETNHITADKAVYAYSVQNTVTNEQVTLTGSPRIENPDGIMTGDIIIWDRANNRISVPVNPHIIPKQGVGGAGTNGAAGKLF